MPPPPTPPTPPTTTTTQKNLSTFFRRRRLVGVGGGGGGGGGGDNLRTFRRAVSPRRMAGWSRREREIWRETREGEREGEREGGREGETFHKIACSLPPFISLSLSLNRPFIYDSGTAQFESVRPSAVRQSIRVFPHRKSSQGHAIRPPVQKSPPGHYNSSRGQGFDSKRRKDLIYSPEWARRGYFPISRAISIPIFRGRESYPLLSFSLHLWLLTFKVDRWYETNERALSSQSLSLGKQDEPAEADSRRRRSSILAHD